MSSEMDELVLETNNQLGQVEGGWSNPWVKSASLRLMKVGEKARDNGYIRYVCPCDPPQQASDINAQQKMSTFLRRLGVHDSRSKTPVENMQTAIDLVHVRSGIMKEAQIPEETDEMLGRATLPEGSAIIKNRSGQVVGILLETAVQNVRILIAGTGISSEDSSRREMGNISATLIIGPK